MPERNEEYAEVVTLGELIRLVWDGKLLLLTTFALVLAVALGTYFMMPKSYRTQLTVEPLRSTAFASYLPAVDETFFSHTPTSMLAVFASSARDMEVIGEAAETSGVVAVTEPAARQGALQDLYQRLTINPAQVVSETSSVQMSLISGDAASASAFLAELARLANEATVSELIAEIDARIATERSENEIIASRLRVDIEAQREALRTRREDRISHLEEQAEIARSINLARSAQQRALDAVEAGTTANIQVSDTRSDELGSYLEGYEALDAQIAQLRADSDAPLSDADLRLLEQRLFVAESDVVADEMQQRIAQTPFADPATAVLARINPAAYSTTIAPRLTYFIAGGVIFGFGLGLAIIILRRVLTPARALS
ncbi:GumC domain-containing protein [Aliihoeflea sp. PC F10.4]